MCDMVVIPLFVDSRFVISGFLLPIIVKYLIYVNNSCESIIADTYVSSS